MKILYIMSSYNIYGGTPKKTLDLIRQSKNECYLYFYENSYKQFKYLFEETGATITEGYYGRNIKKHINSLLKIIDTKGIQLIQTQFTMGEVLGYLTKRFRPRVKLVVAFVGTVEPKGIKNRIVQEIYKKVDAFVYISNYVKQEKIRLFPKLSKQSGKVIYNGVQLITRGKKDIPFKMNHPAMLDIAGLTEIKNIDILIDTIEILLQGGKKTYLYIAGDGPLKMTLLKKIKNKKLENYIHLLGYRTDTEQLLKACDIFVHPCFKDGFGIAVAEAMISEKPVIVANAGALPELIEDGESGLLVHPFDAYAWAKAILLLLDNKEIANKLGRNAKEKAKSEFSVEKFAFNYQELYKSLLKK